MPVSRQEDCANLGSEFIALPRFCTPVRKLPLHLLACAAIPKLA